MLGSWLSGPGAATGTEDEIGYRGRRLGRPERGAGSVAGFGIRFLALFVDWIAATLVAKAFVPGVRYPSNELSGWTLLVFALEVFVLTSTLGSSFGQFLCRLRVERVGGGRLDPVRALVRTVLICLVIPPLVYDRDGRGLHDRAADSVVVRIR